MFGGEDRDFDGEIREFSRRDGPKAWVRVGDGRREMRDRPQERPLRIQTAEATAQLATMVNRHECAPRQIEPRAALERRRRLPAHACFQRTARHAKQALLIWTENWLLHHQTAAAMYPTTDALSPDTSPESAY